MYIYTLNHIRVIDGDTVDADIDLGFNVWIRKKRIRLMGIDCPETRTRDKEEKKYGFLAKEYLQKVINKTSPITLESRGEDKFGRVLGILYGDYNSIRKDWSRSINKQMIVHHHAVAYDGQSKDSIKKEHLVNREILARHLRP